MQNLPPLFSTIHEQTGIQPPSWMAQMPNQNYAPEPRSSTDVMGKGRIEGRNGAWTYMRQLSSILLLFLVPSKYDSWCVLHWFIPSPLVTPLELNTPYLWCRCLLSETVSFVLPSPNSHLTRSWYPLFSFPVIRITILLCSLSDCHLNHLFPFVNISNFVLLRALTMISDFDETVWSNCHNGNSRLHLS